MVPRLALTTAMRLQGRLKLARLLEMREEEMARLARALEADPLFERLARAGALSRRPFPGAYFAARRWAGWSLAPASGGLGDLLDSDSAAVRVLRRIGRERFEESFLRAEGLTDAQRARRCGVSTADAALLRALLDRLYIREEFEPAPGPAPARVFSAVAGVGLEGGKPVLRFFHRDVWKGEFAVDERGLEALVRRVSREEGARLERFARRLVFLGRRQTTLYKALQALLSAQAEWLATGDPLKRQPLTQRSLAAALGVDASAINRLISNKAVELPWGTEAPMRCLLPSAKTLAIEKLEALARRRPDLSDEGLRRELASGHQIHLSRRSVAQYRQDLGLGARGRRGA
ncbi:MAG: hypothetical protein HY554_16365 [Elusimicrobia bacterium]|nr:hypothetical protein [Elusimicrobiota bacterium]